MKQEQPNVPVAPGFSRDIIKDAIGYWEPRRLLYNGVLAVVFVGHFWVGLPGSGAILNASGISSVLRLAVGANLCYCAVYAADLFAHFSGSRETWSRERWLLLAAGTVYAAILTRSHALELLTLPFID